jgi:hypothetical protein
MDPELSNIFNTTVFHTISVRLIPSKLEVPTDVFVNNANTISLALQLLYYPAHNVKNVELLKHIKIKETAPTCFGLQRNHHQGATTSN